jgi:two-component system sensor histidine kinase HydH
MLVDWVRSYGLRQRLRQENEGLRSHILETESYLAQILDHLDEGILTTDLQGRVRSANQVVRDLFRLPTGPLWGQTLEGIPLAGEGLGHLHQVVLRVLQMGAYEGRFLFTPQGQPPFPIYLRGTVYRQQGRPVGTILVFRDLTAQEELELRVEESERLAALGQIAAGMAHEIRNPLIAVGGLLRRLERQMPPDHPSHDYLPAINQNVRRMESMVREIDEYLHYVQASQGQRLELDLGAILQAALEQLQERVDLAAVRLEVKPLPSLPIRGDERSLREMFYQILVNGVEAMPQGGDLSLEAFEEEAKAVIRITDNGRGIPSEHLASIYHPFFTTKMAGAGLGLTKVYMILQRHGGQIEIHSHPQQGTTCTVRLPLMD